MNLNDAQLLKRAKELDAREEYLNTREQLLNDAPITFKVYEARIAAYEKKLESQNIELNKPVKINPEIKKQQLKLKETNNRIEMAVVDLEELEKLVDDRKNCRNLLTKECSAIKKEIAELKEYQKNQEELVEQSIATGNNTLLDFKAVCNEYDDKIKHLKIETALVKREIDELYLKRDDVKSLVNNLTKEHSSRTKKYEIEYKSLVKKITIKGKELQSINKEIDSKLNKLKEKELSLLTKQDAMRLERQTLDTEKRRFNSTKSLYT